MYYTYIVKCENGNLYTGITTDVERRFVEHRSKSKISAKYTRANPAVRIEAVWSSCSRALASKLEYFIKNKADNMFIGVAPCSLSMVHKRLWKIISNQ